MYFMTSVSLNFKELELDFVFVKNLRDVWKFGVFPIHRADFIHGRPIRDGKGRCPVDSASMTTMMMMMTTVHTLPASCQSRAVAPIFRG